MTVLLRGRVSRKENGGVTFQLVYLLLLTWATHCAAKTPYVRTKHVATNVGAEDQRSLVNATTNYNGEKSVRDEDVEDEEASGEELESEKQEKRSPPSGMSDSTWNGMSSREKIKYWERKTKEEVDVVVGQMNGLKDKARKVGGVDTKRIEMVQTSMNALKVKGVEIERGEHTSLFKARYTKLENGQSQLLDRSTPISEQKAERALAAVQSIGTGVAKIKENWGQKGKEWEIMRDLSQMASGVLAVIPSPHTKALAVFLDVISSLIGLFCPSTKTSVKDYIDQAVADIKEEFNHDRFVDSKANLVDLTKYWSFMTTIIDGPISLSQWDNYRTGNEIPNTHAHILPIEKAKAWLSRNLRDGEDGEITSQILQKYWRMCTIMEQTFQRIIQLMPDDAEHRNDKVKEHYINTRADLQKDTFQWIKQHVLSINRHSVMTLQHFYPQGRDKESVELFDYIDGLTYEEDNKVYGPSEPPATPEGSFYLECARWPGWYVYLASDWSGYVERVMHLAQREWTFGLQCGPHGGGCHPIRTRDLGVVITLYNSKSHKIKIETAKHSIPHARKMTFEKDSGKVKFLNSFNPPPSIDGIAAGYRADNVPIFATTSRKQTQKGYGITTKEVFRIIPIKKESGDPGDPVIIGDAAGSSFLAVSETKGDYNSQWPIHMKPLSTEEYGGKKRVHRRHVFYLKK